jgi:hypothetical protein
LANERSKLGFDFNPQAMKIRAAVKPWAGARGWRPTVQRKGQRGRRKVVGSGGNRRGSGVIAALARRVRT